MARFLAPRLKEYLDDELSKAIVNPLSCFLEAAHACVGIMEEGGDNRGPMVEAFQATIGGACGESWCVSFVQALTAYVEERFGVVSNLPLTEHVLTFWDSAPKGSKFTDASKVQACDLILWHYMGTQNGHLGIVKTAPYGLFETIEGNTSPTGIVEREGNGVFEKTPSKTGTIHRPVLGFVRPEFTSQKT